MSGRLYLCLDRVWQWFGSKVFVRFQFDLPVDDLTRLSQQEKVVFVITHGGLIEWLVLSCWCRTQGLGAILISNRLRTLFFAKPKYFFQLLFRRKSSLDLFLSDEPGPRLLFCPSHERKQPFLPTPVEKLLGGLFAAQASGGYPQVFVPLLMLWRRYVRGSHRTPTEYFLGLSSNPNVFGKGWYLFRKRIDSVVKALEPVRFPASDSVENDDVFEDTQPIRIGKLTRRKILVLHNQEMRVVLGPTYHSPLEVKETLLKDPELLQTIREVALSEGIDRKKVMSRAYKILTEVAANYKYRFIEVMYVLLTWLFRKVSDGIQVDEEGIKRIRELVKAKPVVFIPCHRSHLDYLIIPYVFFMREMATPFVAAGVNLAFWPVGYFIRMGGAFFIRRSFRGDILYGMCLSKYIEYLLKNRYTIKFFIEGTRSRTGKMLPPAYGILKMLFETYKRGIVEDIALVPISIAYDEVPEEGSYTKELAGAQKTKESAGALLRSRSLFLRKMGKMYLNVSEPIFLKDFQSEASRLEKGSLALQKLAFQICKRINQVTPLTPRSILCSVLLSHPGSRHSLTELLDIGMALAKYAEFSGHPLSVEGENLRRSMEQVVRLLYKQGALLCPEEKYKAYELDSRKRVLMSYYRNNAIHCYVFPSILILSLFTVVKEYGMDNPKLFQDKLRQELIFLRNLLKFEFFFDPSSIFLDQMEKDLDFFCGFPSGGWKQLPIAELVEKHLVANLGWGYLVMHMRLIGDVLESYLWALDYLRNVTEEVEKKSLVSQILKQVEASHSKGQLFFTESISAQNFSNALLLFENLNLLRIKKESTILIQPLDWNERMDELLDVLRGYLQLMQIDSETLLR